MITKEKMSVTIDADIVETLRRIELDAGPKPSTFVNICLRKFFVRPEGRYKKYKLPESIYDNTTAGGVR